MSLIIAIPARYGSTRLPGKALLPLAGRPLLAHVIDNARQVEGAEVVVVTDDERIARVAEQAGVPAAMTAPELASGTDRIAAAAEALDWPDSAIVVNLQGDEPMLPPSCLRAVAALLVRHPRAEIATLAHELGDVEALFDPNCVKVVTDSGGRAMYFSRAPIPYARDAFARDRSQWPAGLPARRHLGVYAYRVAALRRLAALPVGTLERYEALEQLRALEQGMWIQVGPAPEHFEPGVDTEADLERVERALTLRRLPRSALPTQAAWKRPTRVAFVCMGNICRSPLAQAYAVKRARELGLAERFTFASRGTHAYHQGAPADSRTLTLARSHALELGQHRAARVDVGDFHEFDWLLALDRRNEADLLALAPDDARHKVRLLMSFAPQAEQDEVPDPYLGDHEDFLLAYKLIRAAVDGMLRELAGVAT